MAGLDNTVRQDVCSDEFIKVEIGGEQQYNAVNQAEATDSKFNKCYSCTEFTVCLIDNLGKFGGWTFVILVAVFGFC